MLFQYAHSIFQRRYGTFRRTAFSFFKFLDQRTTTVQLALFSWGGYLFLYSKLITFGKAGSELTTNTKLRRIQRVLIFFFVGRYLYIGVQVGAKHKTSIFNFGPYVILLDVVVKSGLFN